ncbi:hypothetical protein [Nostoc sp.]
MAKKLLSSYLMPQARGGATSTTHEGMEFPADFNKMPVLLQGFVGR